MTVGGVLKVTVATIAILVALYVILFHVLNVANVRSVPPLIPVAVKVITVPESELVPEPEPEVSSAAPSTRHIPHLAIDQHYGKRSTTDLIHENVARPTIAHNSEGYVPAKTTEPQSVELTDQVPDNDASRITQLDVDEKLRRGSVIPCFG